MKRLATTLLGSFVIAQLGKSQRQPKMSFRTIRFVPDCSPLFRRRFSEAAPHSQEIAQIVMGLPELRITGQRLAIAVFRVSRPALQRANQAQETEGFRVSGRGRQHLRKQFFRAPGVALSERIDGTLKDG
jgi:hypothetical protein